MREIGEFGETKGEHLGGFCTVKIGDEWYVYRDKLCPFEESIVVYIKWGVAEEGYLLNAINDHPFSELYKSGEQVSNEEESD